GVVLRPYPQSRGGARRGRTGRARGGVRAPIPRDGAGRGLGGARSPGRNAPQARADPGARSRPPGAGRRQGRLAPGPARSTATTPRTVGTPMGVRPFGVPRTPLARPSHRAGSPRPRPFRTRPLRRGTYFTKLTDVTLL